MDIEATYINIGGQFISESAVMAKKLQGIKAYIFDWDGVFNNGHKNPQGGSSFSEVDSMGTNLLRFSHFLKHGRLPISAVISGEKNETAFYFCRRECFEYSFFKTPNKTIALDFICEQNRILPSEVAYFFDDVLDLSIAAICGLRIMVNRNANPLLTDYCVKNNLVDYLTGAEGGAYAVREGSELLCGLHHNFNEVISNRVIYSPLYNDYIQQRRLIETAFFTVKDNVVQAAEI